MGGLRSGFVFITMFFKLKIYGVDPRNDGSLNHSCPTSLKFSTVPEMVAAV
jgi:hypothetical protein